MRDILRLLLVATIPAACAGCNAQSSAPAAQSAAPIQTVATQSVAPNTVQQQTGPTPKLTTSPPNSRPANLTPRATQ